MLIVNEGLGGLLKDVCGQQSRACAEICDLRSGRHDVVVLREECVNMREDKNWSCLKVAGIYCKSQ